MTPREGFTITLRRWFGLVKFNELPAVGAPTVRREREEYPLSWAAWTDAELEYLKTNWDIICPYKMAAAMKRSPTAISTKAHLLGLGKSKRKRLVTKTNKYKSGLWNGDTFI